VSHKKVAVNRGQIRKTAANRGFIEIFFSVGLVDYLETTEPLRCTITSSNTHFYYEHIRYGGKTQQKKRASSKFLILLKNVYIFNYLKTFPIISIFPRFVTALRQTSSADLKINLKHSLKKC
jgi:hypothetical protein